jgi:hypothetical protein
MSVDDRDRNLLFGVLALQAGFLSPRQFAEACSAWAARKEEQLGQLLVERGWLTPEDRGHVDYLVGRNLERHGDPRASLTAVSGGLARQALDSMAEANLRPPPPGEEGPSSTTAHEPEVRGRYTLTHVHARGGIGQVWLARDAELGRDVALKELRPESAGSPAVLGRFLAEAQITGQLEHPGIVPVYDLDGRLPFYTMRFVKGRTLADAVAAHHSKEGGGALDLRELLTAFIAACNAVAYAHSRGVIHRDLKPGNILLGEFGEVLVVDWGLAKVLGEGPETIEQVPVSAEQGQTVQGQVLGTPAYMAPEQAEGRLDRLGRHTDVYGLGAVLYEVLTGHPPFAGATTQEVLTKVVQEQPPRAPSAPAALEAVCRKALAKRPEDRYGSAQELTRDVQRWLADEPVRAYREPWLSRSGRLWRRHATAVGVVQTLGFVAAIAIVSALQLPGKRVVAEKERELRQAREEAGKSAKVLEGVRANYRLARAALSECLALQRDPRLRTGPLADVGNKLLSAEEGFLTKLRHLPEDNADRAQARWRLGEIRQERGQLKLALMHYHWSLDVEEQLAAPAGPAGRRPIILDTAEARRIADLGAALKGQKWSKKREVRGGTAYSLACLYAQAAAAVRGKRLEWATLTEEERGKGAERYAARAVGLLDRAHAAGYFSKANLDEMKGETLLEPLRSRDDFKARIARWENGP